MRAASVRVIEMCPFVRVRVGRLMGHVIMFANAGMVGVAPPVSASVVG